MRCSPEDPEVFSQATSELIFGKKALQQRWLHATQAGICHLAEPKEDSTPPQESCWHNRTQNERWLQVAQPMLASGWTGRPSGPLHPAAGHRAAAQRAPAVAQVVGAWTEVVLAPRGHQGEDSTARHPWDPLGKALDT